MPPAAPAPARPAPSTGTPAPAKAAGLPEAPKALPPAPASCTAFSQRATPACAADGDAALDALDTALGTADQAGRDTKLAALEKCSAFPAGVVRALRAELAPAECGDALVEPVLAARAQKLDARVEDALVGIGLGARLSRLVHEPPRLEPPFKKERFRDFFKSKLAPWIAGQARAIHDIAAGGAKLHGYGEGVVAVEAGMADMRFVEVVRKVPLPDELAKDKEFADLYYGSLDQALEPRKDRGRDAALVGLTHLAAVGVLHDARVREARAMLSRLYGGRRIDVLDGLMLPALPPFKAHTRSERLAAELPTFYADFVLSKADASDPALLRALLERGVPPTAQKRVDGAKADAPARQLYARFLVELGQTYWRSKDFARAASIAAAATAPADNEPRLIAALAQALQGGPRDAVEMMLNGPFLPGGVGDVAALDRLAHSKSPLSGMAEFDAAYVLQLVAPAKADAGYWTKLAQRYGAAARRLKEKQRTSALDREKAAKATAKAIRNNK
jgi:hypothetical protein